MSQQGPPTSQPIRRPRSPPPAPKHKEKKGFASWFGISKDDEDKPLKADKKKEKGRVEEEASSGFLGSLFGKKKGAEEPMPQQKWNPIQTTAGSLLDRSGAGGVRLINNYYRYPIHVERAVYRLSHIKLANPRRPLYEQVLISNLMFWYLSIINRSANGSYGAGQTQLVQGGGHAPGTTPPVEIEPEEQPASKPGKAKKGSLVKPNRAPPGRGSAETPIATAGYGQQHRQINSEMALQHVNPQTAPTLASQYGLQNAFHQQPTSGPGFTPGQVVDANLLQGHAAGYGANGEGQEMPSGLPNGTYDQSEGGRQEQRWSGGSSGSDPSTSPEAAGQRYAGRPNEQQWQANGRHPAEKDSNMRGGGDRQRRAVSPVESEHAWLGANNSSRGGGGGFSTFGYGDDAPLHEADHRRNQSEPNGTDDSADHRMQRVRSSDPGAQQRGGPPASNSSATPGMVTVTPPEAGPQRSPEEQNGRMGYRSVSDGSTGSGNLMNGKGLHVDDGYGFPMSVSDPASLSLAAMNAPKAGPIVATGLTTKQQQAAGKAAVAAAVAAGRRPPSPQPPPQTTGQQPPVSSAVLDAALLARQSRRSR
jgi:Activator of mitotic machinery Cdc14 phosphatase activation C-term